MASGYNNLNINNSSNYRGSNKYSANFITAGKNKLETQKSQKEQNEEKSKSTKQKSQGLAKMLTTFVGMVSAATVIVGVDTILPIQSSVQIVEFEASASENDVFYYLSLENYDPEHDDVYVVLYNDFTNREEKIEESGWEGSFERLKENMYYTIAVKKGNKVLVSKQVKTYIEKTPYTEPTTSDDPETEPDNGDPTSGTNSDDPNNNDPGTTTNG